jgi:DNA-binding beta-propeller fold protein YncE
MRNWISVYLLTMGLTLGAVQAPKAGKVVLVAGGGDRPSGPATQVKLDGPFGVDFDGAGDMFLVEISGHRVWRMDRKGVLRVFAGTGEKGYAGDGGPALKAKFNGMHGLAIAPKGDIYIADTWNNCVRNINVMTGVITTVAGTGQKGFSGDGGPAARAQFGNIYCVALDPKSERLYLADLDNHRIRAVTLKSGVVTTVAGNGESGVPQERADAQTSPLVDPRAVAVDKQDNVYILERGGHCLRVVDPKGKIRTVAGTGQAGAGGDGGDARRAFLNGPKHLCVDRDGNVIIADTENHLIRKYLPREGKIVWVAGTGRKGAGGIGGPPEQAELNQPHGVYIDPTGALYIVDSSNNRVLRIQ